MKNFKKIFGILLVFGFIFAIPVTFGGFQAIDINSSTISGDQSVDDVTDNSLSLPDYLGLVNHLTNDRQLVKAPTGQKQDFTAVATTNGPMEVIIGFEGNSLLAEQAQRSADGLAPLTSQEQQNYVASLKQTQSQYLSSLTGLGATVIYTYQIVYNGMAVVIDGNKLQTLNQMPGITSISESKTYTPALDTSVPFILGGESYDQLGVDGSGTTVAIIDTGIDYTHADFGGSGNPVDYSTNDPTVVEPGTFPTDKVIGGIDLVGDDYDAGCAPVTPAPGVCSSIPVPDNDPLDQAGHGTHVAGIAAGIGTDEVAHGVAPGAKLLAIKVFGREGSTSYANVIKALEIAVDPNGDGDTSDHADVINMSLGSDYGTATSPEAIASNAAVDAGSIVVAASGNSGNLPYVTGSGLSAADKAISVAAGTDPGVGFQLVTVSGSNGVDGDYPSVEAAITPSLKSVGTVSGYVGYVDNLACNPLADGSLTDQIALISRGDCTFSAKILNAQAAGAVAVVVYNNVAGEPIVMGGESAGITIPGVMISNADGLALIAGLTSTTAITLDPTNFESTPDRMAEFSSAGPRWGDSALKPDITAPGVDIFSAAMGSGTGGVSMQGTSMASPHIAGAAALLRQAHPDWTVQQIKSLMMNTATDENINGEPYPVTQMGAGRVQVNVALDTNSVVSPASVSFGLQQQSHYGKETFTQKLTVHNFGTTSKFFSVSADFSVADDNDGSLKFSNPSYVYVRPGRSATFTFRLTVDFAKLSPNGLLSQYSGFVTLTEHGSSGDTLRVPFLILPMARANAAVDYHSYVDYLFSKSNSLNIRNKGISGTTVDIYQYGSWDPNEHLISQTAGEPRQPDNWFDIQYTGAHAIDYGFTYVEIAVTTYGNRNIADKMATEVYLDVNHDGIPDYVVLCEDYGYLTGSGYPSGDMVTFLYEYNTGLGYLEFLTANDPNTALQSVPFALEDLNALGDEFGTPQVDANNPTFDYTVVTTDLDTGAFDQSSTATFNPLTPLVDAAPNYFSVDAMSSESFDVVANGVGSLLVLYYNNISGYQQSQVVTVGYQLEFHHHHWN